MDKQYKCNLDLINKSNEELISERETRSPLIANDGTLPQHTKDKNATCDTKSAALDAGVILANQYLTAYHSQIATNVGLRKELTVAETKLASDVEQAVDYKKDALEKYFYKTYVLGYQAPVGTIDKVKGLELSAGDFSNTVKATWNKTVKPVTDYIIAWTQGDPMDENSWLFKNCHIESSLKYIIEGLESGKRVYVHVAGIGTAGQGPWSDLLNIIVQ